MFDVYDNQESIKSIQFLTRKIRSSSLMGELRRPSIEFLDQLLSGYPLLYPDTNAGHLWLHPLAQAAALPAMADCSACSELDLDSLRMMVMSFDDGYTYPSMPLSSFDTQLNRIDRFFRKFGLMGFLVPDLELLRFKGFPFPVLCYHWNALFCRVDGSRVAPKDIETKINSLPSVASVLDSPAKVSRLKPGQKQHINIYKQASYSLKFTARVKKAEFVDGKVHTEASRHHLTDLFALQLLQAWSLMPYLKCVRGIGPMGTSVRRRFKPCLSDRLANLEPGELPGQYYSQAEIQQHWRTIWKRLDYAIAPLPADAPKPGRELADALRALKLAS